MRLRPVAVALAVLAAVAVQAPGAAQIGGGSDVDVLNNFFSPVNVGIRAGEKVTWHFKTGGHSVTSDDGLFNFDPATTVPSGQTREFTFTQSGVYGYYCRVHGVPGGGMAGKVYVDVSVPTPEPTPEPTPPPERIVPSSQYPSVGAALVNIDPGTVVSIQPGTYPVTSLTVTAPRITIRGAADDPDDVVLRLSGRSGVSVRAAGVRIENLALEATVAMSSGLAFEGVRGFAVRDVHVDVGGWAPYGVVASESRQGAIRGAHVTGAGEAGIAVRTCRDCDVIVDGVSAFGNAVGYAGINSSGVVVTNSEFRDNATGVFLATLATEDDAPQEGTHVWGNVIADNNASDVPRRGLTETFGAPRGVGVWVAGGWFDVIEANTITGHDRYGVVATWLTTPVIGAQIRDNVLHGDGTHLAWDGLGVNLCLDGNRTPDGDDPTTSPPGAQTLYACGGPPTVGVPNPVVLADVMAAATRHQLPLG